MEADNLPIIITLLIRELTKCNIEYEIIIIDDGSTDGTLDLAHRLQKEYGSNRICVHNRGKKLGLGTAYQYGIQHAKGSHVLILDADLSHHPKYISEMIELQRENDLDIVSGTRYASGGGVYGWDLYRKLTSSVANYIATTLLSPGNASDLTGSFRLYKKDVVENIMGKVKCKGYGFQMEVMVRAMNEGYTLGEVPIVFCDRMYGESKLGAQEIFGYLSAVWYLFTKY